MGKGTDLAKDIIEMTREYNRCIRGLRNEVGALKEDISYLEKRADQAREKCAKYEKILEKVTDIICKYMDHNSVSGLNFIGPIYDTTGDFSLLLDVLEIPLSIDEVKDNE